MLVLISILYIFYYHPNLFQYPQIFNTSYFPYNFTPAFFRFIHHDSVFLLCNKTTP